MAVLKKHCKYFLILLLGTFLISCGTSGNGTEKEIYVTKGSDTVILNTDSMAGLTSPNDGTLSFKTSTDQLESVNVGDILVVAPSDVTPDGALLKVAAIEDNGTGLTFQTDQAAITDAIEECDVAVSKKIKRTELKTFTPYKKGIRLQPVPASKGRVDLAPLVIEFDDVELSDDVTASGSLSLQASFDMDMKIKLFKLRYFEFINTTTQTSDIKIKTNGSVTIANFGKTWEVARIDFTPVVIMVGSFPIILTPAMIIKVGVDGSLSADIDLALSNKAVLELGIIYDNEKWDTIQNARITLGIETDSSMELDVKAFAGPEIQVLLYGVVGPYLFVDCYAQVIINAEGEGELDVTYENDNDQETSDVSGDLNGSLAWELYAGVEGEIGIKVAILSYELVREGWDIFDYKWLLYNGSVTGELIYNVANGGNPVCTENIEIPSTYPETEVVIDTVCE